MENVQYDKVIGIDVHQNVLVCCSLNGTGDQVLIEKASFKADYPALEKLKDWCCKSDPELILMESTGVYWQSPYSILERAGLPVYVVNPSHVKRMIGRKTDMSDAEWLAQVGRLGCYIPSYIPSELFRNLRSNSRGLTKDIQTYKSYKNRETKSFVSAGYRLNVFSDQFGKTAMIVKDAILKGKTAEQIVNLLEKDHPSRFKQLKSTKEELLTAFNGHLTEEIKNLILRDRETIAFFESKIASAKRDLIARVEELDKVTFFHLQTIPGIDAFSAAQIMIENGDREQFVSSFHSADKYSSWLGVCPGNNESAGKRKSGRCRKGNQYLRRILCESAQAARRTKNTTLKSKYDSLVIRLGKKRSVFAIAHKIAKLIYYVYLHEKAYLDPNVDYKALSCKKNRARWVKQLLACEDVDIVVTDKKTGEVFSSELYREERAKQTWVRLQNVVANT